MPGAAGGPTSRRCRIDVVGAAATLPSIAPSSSSIGDCTLGVPCNRTISVFGGGRPPFTWTVSGLPPGMSMRFGADRTLSSVMPGEAELWGTPTAAGTYNVQLRVTDADGATASNSFPISVSPLEQLTNVLPNGGARLRVLAAIERHWRNQSVCRDGFGRTIAGRALAQSATLLVSGTPVEDGSFSWVTTYTDGVGATLRAATNVYISSDSAISINNSGDLGTITVGSSYSNVLSSPTACCSSPYTWSMAGGTLPPGLSLSSTTGQWSGTAGTPRALYVPGEAAQMSNPANFAVRQFTFNVTPISITTSSTLPFGNVGSPYSQALTATGGTGARSHGRSRPGAICRRGSRSRPACSVARRPSAASTSSQLTAPIRAAIPGRVLQRLDLSRRRRPACRDLDQYELRHVEHRPDRNGSLTATAGGAGSYRWSISAGSLPPGTPVRTDLPSCCFPNRASGGLIGVATTPGNYNFTLQVTSGSDGSIEPVTMRITALTVKENQLPDAFVGVPFGPYTLTALNGAGGSTGTWTATKACRRE